MIQKVMTSEGKIIHQTILSNGEVINHAPVNPVEKMLVPVICNRCKRTYDLCNTEVIHRYADCTLYKTPCCKQNVDDREWVSNPAFTRIKK